MPVTVILAVTVRSGLILTVPLPDAVVVTGGTSLLPESVTACPPPIDADIELDIDCICEQLARTTAAPAAAMVTTSRRLLNFEFMVPPFVDTLDRLTRTPTPADGNLFQATGRVSQRMPNRQRYVGRP
jgi:hypothetical protein